MVDIDALKGLMTQNRLTGCQIAPMIGLTPNTMYRKLKSGKFSIDECNGMAEILRMNDYQKAKIFFARSVNRQVTESGEDNG